MKKVSISFFITMILASTSFAKLAIIPLSEAIKNNDLMIVGMLTDISESEDAASGVVTGKGKIIVEEFIAGNVKVIDGKLLKPGDELELKYVESFSCVMDSHKRIENNKGIFLLKLNAQGNIEYEDFRSLGALSEIKELLKKGVKLQQKEQFIKILNQTEQIENIESDIEKSGLTFYCSYSTEVEERNALLYAFLTALASLSLYCFLYRSRFKIR